MLVRIVKLTFQPTQVDSFLELFKKNKQRIRSFPGCHHLELLRADQPANVFFTYSVWDSPASLEVYRNSPLFKATWSATKQLFAEPPQAWSTQSLEKMP